MKLITEQVLDIKIIKEESEDKKLSYYIDGLYMQSESKNRNNRVYPDAIIDRIVKEYTRDFIKPRRSIGELSHPIETSINLERVSHFLVSLNKEGNDVYGRSKILDTPYGKIAKNLIDEEIQLGVSTRGIGSLEQRGDADYVMDDFQLIAVDIVADPSVASAFVNGVLEGKEWIVENGCIKSIEIEKYKDKVKKIKKKLSAAKAEEAFMYLFEDFVSKLKLL